MCIVERVVDAYAVVLKHFVGKQLVCYWKLVSFVFWDVLLFES